MKKIMVFIVTGLFFVGVTSFTLADDLIDKTMANETVGHVKVIQEGVFVLRMGFYWGPDSKNYQNNDSPLGGDQLVGRTYTYKLGSEYGITNGSTISPRFYVVSVGYAGGRLPKFVYEEGNPQIAEFTVSGTTGNIVVKYNGILTP